MEHFSEKQKENAVKFMLEYVSQWGGAGSSELKPHRQRFTAEEMEGECLHMARSFLSEKGCPGILSYHISHQAVKQVVARPKDDLWAPEEEEEGKKEDGGEEAKEKVSEEEKTTEPVPKQKLLDAGLVGTALLAAVGEICQEWSKTLPELTQIPGDIELSFCAIKNTRRKMEDRHAICVDINSLFGLKDCPPQSYYAVFDGHVSVEAAEYAAVHMLPNVVRHQDFLTDPQSALKGGILTTDQRFCQINMRAGSTAVLALLRGRSLYVAWVGDSQAVLFRRGKGTQLVNPHKPDREDERERIEGLGGLVIWLGAWRVNGNLSVSRSIGDGSDKKFISGEAEISCEDLDGTEDYLVVACDGVWDVLNCEEMAEEANSHFTGGGSKQSLAKRIVNAARREGSGDNMTVIIVYFDTFKMPAAQPPAPSGEEPHTEADGAPQDPQSTATDEKSSQSTE